MPPDSRTILQMNRAQRRKLRRLLLDAWRNVPMYRAIYEPLGFTERDLSDPDVLTSLPVLTKGQLLATPVEDRVNRRFDARRLTRETTTGSTGQPFVLHIERRYRVARNLRFLRGLVAAGYRPWHRMLLLTDRHAGLSRRHNWYYQSVERPTGELVDAYLQVRPHVLYGFTTPLRLLAERLAGSAAAFCPPRIVVSTAEMLDPATRRLLENAFGCPVVDFYGMTEMGLAAWQRPGVDGYIMSGDAIAMELEPDGFSEGRYRMLMTNLDLRASPIIRFDSGDLAFAEMIEGVPAITSFEGRLIDTIVRRDGTELSPYRITDALRDVPGVRRFKVTQHELNALNVDLEVDRDSRSLAVHRVDEILRGLLGEGIALDFGFCDSLVPEGARKFRPVESLVSRS